MLTHPTLDKLQTLKCTAMATALAEQMRMPAIKELAVAARRHQNVAVVALANRMARTAYALLAKGEDYQADHVLQTA